jgi:carbon storage regulator CsrA
MLVIARHEDEEIVITAPNGDVISVMVVRGGANVRLGIGAPRSYAVHRREVNDEIVRSGRSVHTVRTT